MPREMPEAFFWFVITLVVFQGYQDAVGYISASEVTTLWRYTNLLIIIIIIIVKNKERIQWSLWRIVGIRTGQFGDLAGYKSTLRWFGLSGTVFKITGT